MSERDLGHTRVNDLILFIKNRLTWIFLKFDYLFSECDLRIEIPDNSKLYSSPSSICIVFLGKAGMSNPFFSSFPDAKE